ncbi:preprotein translocase subunit SecA [Burkholderia lata]|uniref:Preprotein translocase subunit SecA n=2 Tax=Burkholderia lata (strain ATCC 17760 / DSM 23089 / LMG 22485 / NCIMB 9086 / R18194 / 383) TaxID=482957 RepID=A0A6P2T0P0_BURL3|nr:preprotein translocase subunit SecA [Burkholderia lata]
MSFYAPVRTSRSRQRETSMLSAHEFATLLLVHRAPEQLQIDREDVVALVERHLIVMQYDAASGEHRPALTAEGLSVVRCVQRSGESEPDVTDA